jgi:hypothetical protein
MEPVSFLFRHRTSHGFLEDAFDWCFGGTRVLLSESHVFSLDRTLARFSRNTNCDNRIAARFPERKRVINSDHETKS